MRNGGRNCVKEQTTGKSLHDEPKTSQNVTLENAEKVRDSGAVILANKKERTTIQ